MQLGENACIRRPSLLLTRITTTIPPPPQKKTHTRKMHKSLIHEMHAFRIYLAPTLPFPVNSMVKTNIAVANDAVFFKK